MFPERCSKRFINPSCFFKKPATFQNHPIDGATPRHTIVNQTQGFVIFFYLIRRIKETAGSKIIWITDDFHSVTVTQSVSKNLCRSNKILKVSPNVIRWCVPVVLIHTLLQFCFKADIVNSNTFSSLQKVSRWNRPSLLLKLNMCVPVCSDSLWIQIIESLCIALLKIMFPWLQERMAMET